MTASPPVVRTAGLAKSFGDQVAVSDVDLAMNAGDCLAVFGPNGAGKTTLLKLLAGVLKPTRGLVEVNGVDVRRDVRARGSVGFISHHTQLYPALSALENVTFAARLHGVSRPSSAALRALEAMHVGDRARSPVRTLSRGLQQRVSIARATVHDPSIVLLDEPYTGLDHAGSRALTILLRRMLDGGATLVLVTHNVGEGLEVATHAAVMTAGRLGSRQARPPEGFDAGRYAADYRRLVPHA